jgi:hypothetical protein
MSRRIVAPRTSATAAARDARRRGAAFFARLAPPDFLAADVFAAGRFAVVFRTAAFPGAGLLARRRTALFFAIGRAS